MSKRYFVTFVFSILICLTAMADAIGSWKVFHCYNDITDIEPTSKKVFVLASGNLYSCTKVTGNSMPEVTGYSKLDGLNGTEITNIAWCKGANRLIICYEDCNIDIMDNDGNISNLAALYNKEMTGSKSINSIYCNGKYAYISTGFGILKIDPVSCIILDTYNLGYNVKYCYIEGNSIIAMSNTNGKMEASLSDNLIIRSNWTRTGDYQAKPTDTYFQDTYSNCYWGAGDDSKLTRYKKTAEGGFEKDTSFSPLKPDGPASRYIYRMCISDDKMYFVPGRHDINMTKNVDGMVMSYDGEKWNKFGENGAEFSGHRYRNLNYVAVNPVDKSIVAVGAETGLYIFKDGVMTTYYDCSNSPIATALPDNTEPRDWSFIQSMVYDSKGNLWLCNFGNKNVICLTNSGEWKSWKHDDLLVSDLYDFIDGVVLDKRGLLWFCSTRWAKSRIFRYDIQKDQLKRYDTFVNQDGTSYEPYLRRLAEDKEGNIWITTNVGVFYIKSANATSNDEVMYQHKVSRNDGTNLADYLLSGVSCVVTAFDKANRKWIGTSDNGVYVISSDCNTQSEHFTKDNSPLPSNSITDIKINDDTGVVYIATSGGLCSYNSGITTDGESLEEDNVTVYPNPVTPDYTGRIAIAGLAFGSQVKILSSAGQLIHEGTCSDGTYYWDGCDMNGDRVASGVYMVNVAHKDGSKGIVTKIAIVR